MRAPRHRSLGASRMSQPRHRSDDLARCRIVDVDPPCAVDSIHAPSTYDAWRNSRESCNTTPEKVFVTMLEFYPSTMRPTSPPLMRASPKTDARVLVCLGLASVLVNMLLLAWFGIHTGNDSFRYMSGAEDLLNGRPFRIPSMSQYLGYVGVVALCRPGWDRTDRRGRSAARRRRARCARALRSGASRSVAVSRGCWRRPRSSSISTSPGGARLHSSATLSTSRSS